MPVLLVAIAVGVLSNCPMPRHWNDFKKSFSAQRYRKARRAQRDIDLRPDRYTHYYKKEFPARYHAMI
jgi:hypothetical protein